MSKLMQHTGNFINEKCEKCGNFLVQNPWGQKWCMKVKSCGWFDDTITTDHPMPKEVKEAKEVAKKKARKKKGE